MASFLALFSFTSLFCQEPPKASVLVCYGDINADRIRNFKYVILESEQYNPFDIRLMKETNELVLGYISVGEVSTARYYFPELKDRTLGKNSLWDSYYLDLADPVTQNALMGLVDRIKQKGFDGLFLDTVDAYGPWGPHPEKVGAYVEFISRVKEKYPDFHLMQNSGVSITPRTKDFINSVALESVITDYNFEKSDYRMRRLSEYNERVAGLKNVEEKYNLPIVLIEYANTKSMFNRVRNQATALGWDYFIGNIGLEELPRFK